MPTLSLAPPPYLRPFPLPLPPPEPEPPLPPESPVEPGRHSGLFTSVQPELVTVVTRVPQPTTEGSRPVIPMPWVRFDTAGSCPMRTGLPESPP